MNKDFVQSPCVDRLPHQPAQSSMHKRMAGLIHRIENENKNHLQIKKIKSNISITSFSLKKLV